MRFLFCFSFLLIPLTPITSSPTWVDPEPTDLDLFGELNPDGSVPDASAEPDPNFSIDSALSFPAELATNPHCVLGTDEPSDRFQRRDSLPESSCRIRTLPQAPIESETDSAEISTPSLKAPSVLTGKNEIVRFQLKSTTVRDRDLCPKEKFEDRKTPVCDSGDPSKIFYISQGWFEYELQGAFPCTEAVHSCFRFQTLLCSDPDFADDSVCI